MDQTRQATWYRQWLLAELADHHTGVPTYSAVSNCGVAPLESNMAGNNTMSTVGSKINIWISKPGILVLFLQLSN